MRLILRRLSRNSIDLHPIHRRFASYDATNVNFVRDRGLDHVVERERNLRPVINVKNLLKAEPSKSLPLSVIADQRFALQIPVRPIEFLRRYPSVFEEFNPGGVAIHPHFKLKGEVLELDAEENLIYQSEDFKKDAAARVLKLLMIARVHKIPLSVIDSLQWDLGLPRDFVKTIVPEFPDHFRVVGSRDPSFSSSGCEKDANLELVYWKKELATSVVEKKGIPVNFSMQYSKGFEMDKKYQKWVDDWQKLPYISPYENGTHLGPNTDESDKWAASVLHEILHLFVSKKSEKDNVLLLGDYLGIRSRFKRAMLNHPGIFYLSNKIGTYTVVLKEAFKRGSLIEDHSIMTMRSRYLHLMSMAKEDSKVVTSPSSSKRKQKEKKEEGSEFLDEQASEFKDDEAADDETADDETDDDEHDDDITESESDDEVEDARQMGARQYTSPKRKDGTKQWDRNIMTRPMNPNRGKEGRTPMNGKRSSQSFNKKEFHKKGDNFRAGSTDRSKEFHKKGDNFRAGSTDRSNEFHKKGDNFRAGSTDRSNEFHRKGDNFRAGSTDRSNQPRSKGWSSM